MKYDFPYPAEAEMHIQSELVKCGIEFKPGKKDFKLRCPFADCPSLKKLNKLKLEVRKDGRKAHCWSCNWKGTWQTLAPIIGAAKFNGESNGFSEKALEIDMFANLATQLREINPRRKDLILPVEELSTWNGINNSGQPWRGLSVSFLQSVPTFAWHQVTDWGELVERILFPFYQRGELVGYSGRRLDNIPNFPYFNADYMPAKNVFYPYDYVLKTFSGTDRIVLVEGQVDALWFLYNHIPTFSIQGTNNWSDFKRDLLVAMGVQKVLICMDPDDAGKHAVPIIYESLNKIMEKVTNLELPAGTDPGDSSVETVNWVRQFLYSL